MVLGVGDHRQVILQTPPVREPSHRPGRADEIPELMGTVQRSRIVVDYDYEYAGGLCVTTKKAYLPFVQRIAVLKSTRFASSGGNFSQPE